MLLFNVPVGLAVLAAAVRLLRDTAVEHRPRLDVPGAVLATAGLGILVLGITQTEAYGWTSAQTLVPVATGLVLLVAFVELQRRTREPLMPLGLFRLPGLAVANAVTLTSSAGLFAVWFFQTLYMQEVLGWAPLHAGIGVVPQTVAIMLGTQIATRWLPRRDSRVVVSLALALSVAGFMLMRQADADTGYLLGVGVPGVLIMFGAGVAVPRIIGAATAGVPPSSHGLASGVVNTTRMVGGALGLAVLATVAAARATDAARAGASHAAALVAGFHVAFGLAAAAMALAAGLAWLLPAPRHARAAQPMAATEGT